jgi:hypothetical protein
MSPYIWFLLFFFLFLNLVVGIAIWMRARSYRNRARIARQTGSNSDDVIWIEDTFRVKNTGGAWVIQFKKLREKTTSIPGSYWMKFVLPSALPKVLKYTDEEWKGQDLSKLIQRGIMFYETSEGEFHPMSVSFDGVARLHTISQDNKQFLISEIKDINSLTRNRFKEMMLLGGIVLAVFVLAVVFILGIIYLKESAQDSLGNSQQACIEYYRLVQNISGVATQEGGAQFLDQATNLVMQGEG